MNRNWGKLWTHHNNAEVNETFQRLYDGLPLSTLKRLGKVTSPTQEML